MSADLAMLFDSFDRGRLSRRQLLAALGIAAVVRPVSAFAQGQCGGARAGTPECDPTPAKLPFEPTGWKTVLLDHFSCQVADYPKEAAFYAALMNWKIRSDDGKQAVLDIGDWAGLVLRGGYQPPAGAEAAPAGRGGAPTPPPTTRRAAMGHISFGITPFDPDQVKAELEKRGLNARMDTGGRGDIHTASYKSYHTTTPNGFDLQISATNRSSRTPTA